MRFLRGILRIAAYIGLLGFLGVASLASLVLFYSREGVPSLDRIADYHPKVTTRVLAADGQLIGEIFEERRTLVPLTTIPPLVKQAFIAAEDAQFLEHRGINLWALMRAVVQSIVLRQPLRGASTITQQLARAYILKDNRRFLKRKFREMYVALRIERILSKEEILWIYLNQIYFGHQRYGIEEAARFHFGKSVSDLNVGEAAALAALPKSPDELSPRRNPDRAKLRQRYVLSQMARQGYISPEEAWRWAEAPIQLVKEGPQLSRLAPEFVGLVKQLLIERFGRERLPYLGLNVRTSCKAEVQREVRSALEEGLRRIDERSAYRLRRGRVSGANRDAYLQELRREFPNGPPIGRIVEGVITKVLDGARSPGWAEVDLGAARGILVLAHPDRYNPKGLAATMRFMEGDVVRVRIGSAGRERLHLELENGPQGAAIVIDPETRHVLAMVGGYGYLEGFFNRALHAKRQPGSAFKPFVYAAAFESRRYTAASVLSDSPQVFDLPDRGWWAPKNSSSHDRFLGPVRLRRALAESLNTVAAQLIYDLKPGPVIAMAQAAGIKSTLREAHALALGVSEVNLLELVNSYATLAARGRRGEPLFILQVGNEKPAVSALTQVMTPSLAFLMTDVMRSVIEEGTGSEIRGKLRHPAAGKTGTSGSANGVPDCWFIGYTPSVVAGVWVGFDDRHSLDEKATGGRIAAPIWSDVMNAALRDRPIVPFAQPTGTRVVRIDPVTGLRTRHPRAGIAEVFLDGTQPTTYSPR